MSPLTKTVFCLPFLKRSPINTSNNLNIEGFGDLDLLNPLLIDPVTEPLIGLHFTQMSIN